VLRTDGSGTTTWIANPGSGSTPINSITAATASQAGIANGAYTIQWNWDTLTNGTAMTLSSTSMTTGTILSLTNTNAASSTGTVLNVSNASVGAAYAIKGTSASTGTGTGVYGAETGA
jgi:trimeric autotransporter adhesin